MRVTTYERIWEKIIAVDERKDIAFAVGACKLLAGLGVDVDAILRGDDPAGQAEEALYKSI